MGIKIYTMLLTLALFFFLFIQTVSARENNVILPVLSDDAISQFFSQEDEERGMRLVQNTPPSREDDKIKEDFLEEDFLEEYEDPSLTHSIADPLYYFNYAMYTFNDVLYFAAIEPIASGYKAMTPTLVRKGVNNFFHNLLFPVRFVNNILQGKIRNAGTEIEIFLINSTAGILGFCQVAQKEFDIQTSNEDLGQTLGSYSIGNGFYLVLPILGPSTFRDAIGRVGDYFLTPVNYVEPGELSSGINAYDSINAVSFRLGDYEALKKAAIDPYAAIKNAYIQNRKKKVKE